MSLRKILLTLSLREKKKSAIAKLNQNFLTMCLSDTHNVRKRTIGSCVSEGRKRWLYLKCPAFYEAGPHSWVISRQIREVGSVAWLALTNLTAASLGQ